MTADVTTPHAQRQWFIVGRCQEYEGEGRANLLRIIAILGFYSVQLVRFLGMENPTDADCTFHSAATWISMAWVALGLAILYCLRQRVFPASLKYFSTGGDLILLTALAALGAKASSPLIFVYFLIIALAALRFSLLLVWVSTIGSLLGYMALVGVMDDKWFDADHVVALHVQLITLLSLGLTGIVVGQLIRRTRSMATDFAQRMSASNEGAT